MPKVDTNSWNNIYSLRKRMIDMTKLLLLCATINAMYLFAIKNWILFGLNILYAIITLPVFFSKAKFDKEPPVIINNEVENK